MSHARPTGGPTLARLALSPDGRWLYAAHAAEGDSALALINEPGPLVVTAWDLDRGGRVGRFVTEPVASPALVALGPTRRVLVAHRDGAFVLDLETNTTRALQHALHDSMWGPPVADARGVVAIARSVRTEGHAVFHHALETGVTRPLDARASTVFAVSPNGAWIAYAREVATGGQDVRVIDGRDGREHATSAVLPMQLWGARRMVIDDTGRFVAWTSRDGVYLWRVGEPTPQPPRGGALDRAVLAFERVGPSPTLHVLDGDLTGKHLAIDTASGQEHTAKGPGYVVAVAISLDGRRGAYGTLESFGVVDFQPRPGAAVEPASVGARTHDDVEDAVDESALGDVSSVAYLDGPGGIVTASRAHGRLALWTLDGRCVGALDTGAAGLRALHACPDGETLVFVGTDGALGTCRPRGGLVRRWPTPFVYANELALDARGARAFCVHGLVGGMRGKNYGRNLPREKEDTSSVWDVERGALVATLDHIPQLGQSAAWLADGSGRLRLRRGTAVHLLALPSGEPSNIEGFPFDWDPHAPSPCLVPGGRAILTTVKDQVVVWDLDAKETRATLGAARHAKVLALDPQGLLAVVRTPGEGAWVARLADGAVVLRLEECTGGETVAAAAFGASGHTLALVLEDQSVRAVALG